MGVGCCFEHIISICHGMIPFAKIDLLEEDFLAMVSTLSAQRSRACWLTGGEEGIPLVIWGLLPPKSQGCGDAFASLHTEAGERSKNGVKKPFLLLARDCSSAGLRGGTHPRGGVVRWTQLSHLWKCAAPAVTNKCDRHCCEMTSFKQLWIQLNGSQKRIEPVFD